MRILTLSNMYPPHHLGGYELSCWDVMRRFEARGHEVAVLTTDMRVAGVSDGTPAESGGVHRDLGFYWEDHVLLSPPLRRRVAIERHNQRVLRGLLDRFRPDVVSVWNMGAMSLGLLNTIEARRLPMLLAVCDDWLAYGPNLDAWMRLFRQRPAAGRVAALATRVPTRLAALDSAAFCFVSEFTRQTAERDGWPAIKTSTVVGSGIEPGDFSVDDGVRLWGWRLLYVGRVDERKGVTTLVRAMALLPPEATLEIVGRGDADYVASLHVLAEELGIADRITFDAVDRPALAEHYRRADVVVFPPEWDEPFGLVPIEAMACGTPVVATGTGGSADFLVDGTNAVLYPPGDPDALADGVRRIATDEVLRQRLVEAGLVTASELTVDRLADVFETWHQAVAERFANGVPPDLPPLAERIRDAVSG